MIELLKLLVIAYTTIGVCFFMFYMMFLSYNSNLKQRWFVAIVCGPLSIFLAILFTIYANLRINSK